MAMSRVAFPIFWAPKNNVKFHHPSMQNPSPRRHFGRCKLEPNGSSSLFFLLMHATLFMLPEAKRKSWTVLRHQTLTRSFGMAPRLLLIQSSHFKQRSVYVIVLCYAMLCYAVLCCAVLCYAVVCCAVLCCAMLWYAVLCCAMLCCAMLCYAVLCYAVLCCAVLCCAMLCYAMLCYAILCSAMLCYA